jgi:4'-phosphopantetheinyl transferase
MSVFAGHTPAPSDVRRYRRDSLRLSNREVHLWHLTFAELEIDLQRDQRWLSAVEHQRAEKFQREIDRWRFIGRRVVMRRILARYLRMRPEAIRFEMGAFGKLQLAEEFVASQLNFNLSHSEGEALLAVTIGQAVGADLERMRDLDNVEDLLTRCFSTAERTALRSIHAYDPQQFFYKFWTCKEAVLKAFGVGLNLPLESVRIDSRGTECEFTAELTALNGDRQRFFVKSFSPCAGYAGAIACASRPRSICCFEASGQALFSSE